MARLSAIAGDYTQSGMIIDRQQYTAEGGELGFDLTFIDGSEEVYVDGARKLKGATEDYVTGTGKIIFNNPLTLDQKILLIGRASSNEIPYSRSVSESVVVENGQTEVTFLNIGTEALEVYVSGPLVDRGRLDSPQDYELKPNSSDTIILTSTFPAGTIIQGIQGDRLAWVDADNLVVNDGTDSKSLSTRFKGTLESDEYFMRTNATQLQTLSAGMILEKWLKPLNSLTPVTSALGTYPALKLGYGYWIPDMPGLTGRFQVLSWTQSGEYTLIVNCLEVPSGDPLSLVYRRRTSENGRLVLQSDNGDYFELIVSNSGELGTIPLS